MEKDKNQNKGLQMNEITEKTKASFKTRVITAIIMAAIVIPCVIFGNWAFAILVFVVACLATYEFIHCLSKQKHFLWIDIFTFIMTISFMYWFMIKNQIGETGKILDDNGYIMFSDIGISTLGIAFMICILFLGSFLTSRFNVPDVCYYVTMAILLSLGIQSFYFIRYVPYSGLSGTYYNYDGNYITSCLFILYFLVGTCFTDIGAYCVGVLFGKHKMNPRISPNKTWEGFYGGILISFISSFLFGFLLSYFGYPLIYGILDKEHWYWILLISLVMPFASVIGDFIFSAIKRHYEIKDFSNLLPGHGGILDRIDSALINGIVVTMIVLAIAHFPFIS